MFIFNELPGRLIRYMDGNSKINKMTKFNGLLIAISILFFLGCKKHSNSPGTPPVPIGEKFITIGDSTSGSVLAMGVYRTQDSKFIISGTKWLYDSTVGYLNYFPMRITVNSNLALVKSKAPLTYDYGGAIQSLEYNNYVYTAINVENTTTHLPAGVKVIKTDTLNNVLWSKVVTNLSQATCFTLLSNGSFLMQGSAGTDNSMALLKLDTAGNATFRKDYTGQFLNSSFDVLEESNNYTLVAYQIVNHPHYFQTINASLLKIDFSGNIISTNLLDSFMSGSAHYYSSFHLRKNPMGGYILTTSSTAIVDPTVGGVIDEYFHLKMLNPDGSTSNSIDLTVTGNHKIVFEIPDVLQTQNENIYVLVCCDTGSEWYTEVLKFDAKGNYQDYKDMLTGEYPVGLSEAENNNFIMIHDYSAGNSITVLKMDPGLDIL